MGMALGSTSPRSIRRWIREAKDPPSWWNLIEAEATLTEGKIPAITSRLSTLRKAAHAAEAKDDDDDDDGEAPVAPGRSTSRGTNVTKSRVQEAPSSTGKAETPAPGHQDATGTDSEEAIDPVEMEAAERILTVLEVDSLEEAANKVESLVKHHDQVEAMFALGPQRRRRRPGARSQTS